METALTVILGWTATLDGCMPAAEAEDDLGALAASEVDDTPPSEGYRPRH